MSVGPPGAGDPLAERANAVAAERAVVGEVVTSLGLAERPRRWIALTVIWLYAAIFVILTATYVLAPFSEQEAL